MSDVDRLIERTVTDPAFRAELFTDPVGTVNKYGYQLSGHQTEALQSMDRDELRHLAEDLDERLSKGCCYTCGAGCTLG